MIRITDQYFWNVIFGIFFLSVFLLAAIVVDSEGYLHRDNISVADIVIITLATFRMTRLFVYDAITKFIREQFYNAEVKRGGNVVLTKPESGPRRTLADLFSCPWCFGLWSASFVSFFYLLTPVAYFPALVLAIAGVATLIQIFANLLGNTAERLK